MKSGSVKRSQESFRNKERRMIALKNVEQISISPVTPKQLDSAIDYLKHIKLCVRPQIRQTPVCNIRPYHFVRERLRNQNYGEKFLMTAIRNALLSHKWDTALDLTLLLFEKRLVLKDAFLVRVSLQIVLHHPNSSPQLIFGFFKAITKYLEEGDVEKFILMLFRLKRNNEFAPKAPNDMKCFNVVDNPFLLELLTCDSVDEN